ncbi:MAG TPA: TonB-dependent receptor, partial [Sphingomonas sp.]
PRRNDDTNGNGVQDAGEGRVINAGTPFQSTLFDSFPLPTGFDRVYVPLGGGSRSQSFDRERLGFSGSAQFENASRTLLVTAQFLRAESKEDWIERTVEPNVYYGDVTTVFPVGPNPFTYDDNGIFTSGTLGKRTGQVFGNIPTGCGINETGGLIVNCPLNQFSPNGIFTTQSNRHFYSKSITQDQSLNIKFRPTDRLKLNFDAQYVTSDVDVRDDILDTATFSQTFIDLRGGGTPIIQSLTPGFDTAGYFANPNSIYFRDAFNGRQLNEGKEYAFRGDAQYDISEDGFLRNVRVGARYAHREQLVRSADYVNWGNLSETWAAAGPISFAQSGAGSGELYNFTDFFRGDAVTPPSVNVVPENILRNRGQFLDLLRRVTAQGGGSYRPYEDRVRADGQPLIEGTFLPGELFDATENTIGAYARVDFGIDDFGSGMGISGNIGLRYVNTRDTSVGSVNFPLPVSIFDPSQVTGPNPATGQPYPQTLAGFCQRSIDQPPASGVQPAICTVSPAQQQAVLAYANGASVPETIKQKYDHYLPSINVKLQVTPELLFRFAGSKAISRPNFGDLRNYIGISPSGGNTTGVFQFQGAARNPFLRPIEAKQFDLTGEWYFAKVGSLTATAFYKDISKIIVDNAGYTRTFTNNGQTFDIGLNGPINVPGSATIKGFELGYQQTYDFLPGLLRGLGFQANYTFVKAGNIPNPVPANASNDGNRPPQDVAGLYDNLPLQGLSKHTFNVAGFYDLGPIYTRVAYSWRSKFLLTNRDCCFPFLPVYALPTGQLDASLFVTVNKNFKLGLTGSNLLDATTKTNFLLNGDGLEAPRSFFKNDRTFSLTARITY